MTVTTRPRGRPPKAPHDLRSIRLVLRLTEAEAARLRREARAGDVPVSILARTRVLLHRI